MFRNNTLSRGGQGNHGRSPLELAHAFDAAQGTDAAASSGMAFLASQLELIDPEIVKPLEETTHQRDIHVELGGGYPEQLSIFASSYASAGTQGYGLQATNNTEIPMVSVDVQKGTYPVIPWTAGFSISLIDMKRMAFAVKNGQPPPISLQSLYEEAIAGTFDHMLDGLLYTGFQSNYGLANNANVSSFIALNGGSGTAWQNKSPLQILNDINFAQNLVIQQSGYAARKACPNTLLLPLQPQFGLLSQPMTIGGIGYQSLADYIYQNCIATRLGVPFKIDYLPNTWISGQGFNSTDRGIMYRKDKENLYMKIPTAATFEMTTPSTRIGGGFESIYMGAVAPPIFKRTITMTYLDGI